MTEERRAQICHFSPIAGSPTPVISKVQDGDSLSLPSELFFRVESAGAGFMSSCNFLAHGRAAQGICHVQGGVGNIWSGGGVAGRNHLILEVIVILTRVRSSPVQSFENIKEACGHQGSKKGSDPVYPMVSREIMGDDIGAEGSGGIDTCAGIIDTWRDTHNTVSQDRR